MGYRQNMTADVIAYDTDIAGAAALIADPARAAMLRALVCGRPLAAGELASLAGVSAATASFHLAKLRRQFAGECVDWTERRGHLNGALAAAITARLFELGWIERGSRRRNVRITAAGGAGLAGTFGLRTGP